MSWSTSIRVVDDEGDPISGAKVTINFSIFTGIDTQYTDDDGWAEFSYDSIDDNKLWANDIYINSERVAGECYIEDGETQSFTKPD
jgi:hypothetical protein